MKKCPKCYSVVREKNECPICGESLAYVEESCEAREKIRLNKHYLLYLVYSSAFSIVCLLIILFKVIVSQPTLDYSYFIIFGTAALSLIASLSKRTLIRWNEYVCTRSFSIATVNIGIIISGITSVIIALAIW